MAGRALYHRVWGLFRDPICVNIESNYVIIVSHETFEVDEMLSTSVNDWLR